MKKVLFAAAVALTVGLTACGNGASKTETTTDSTAVTAVDSTTAQIPAVDTTSTK